MTGAVFNHVKCLGEIQSPSVPVFSLYAHICNLGGIMAERTIYTPKRTVSVRALTAFVDTWTTLTSTQDAQARFFDIPVANFFKS